MTSASRITIDKSNSTPVDIQRELQTYQIAHDNVNNIMAEFKKLKIVLDRPHDYLAEMYKTDTHMGKIRKHLAQKEVNIKECTILNN